MMKACCTFCGSEQPQVCFSTNVGDSIFCEGCGGIQNRNKAALPAYTKEYYRQHYASLEQQQTRLFARVLNRIEPLVQHRRVLDIGCGTGVFLKVAHRMGYRASAGIDVHSDAVDIARENLAGTDVSIHSGWEEIEGQFGVISFMDSIGHIEKMEKTVSALIIEKLAPDGLLIIKTPHFSQACFRYGQLLGWILQRLGRSNTVSQELFFLPNRYWLFTEQALESFLRRRGFTILERTVEPEYSVRRQSSGSIRGELFQMLFRHLPRCLWGKKTIVVVARKEGNR